MPRGFTESQMLFYNNKLLEVGTDLFSKFGLGVTIDQIINEVGISKGSFYKFYRNKEELCYATLMKLEEDIQETISMEFKNSSMNKSDKIKKIVTIIPEVIKKHPLLNIFLDQKSLQTLFLKIDPELHQKNFDSDTLFLGNIIGRGEFDNESIKSITSILWVSVLITLNPGFFNGNHQEVVDLLGELSSNYYGR